MVDFEKELLQDLGDITSSESEAESQEADVEIIKSNNQSRSSKSLDEKLQDLFQSSRIAAWSKFIEHSNLDNLVDVETASRVRALIPEVEGVIKRYQSGDHSDYLDLLSMMRSLERSEEYNFILKLNEFVQLVHEEINYAHSFLKVHYKVVFSELEALVLNPADYARVVLLINQDLANIRKYETDLASIVSSEKVLVIIMAAVQQSRSNFTLDQDDFNLILKAGLFILELDAFLKLASEYVSSRLSKIAPNVCSLVGPIICSQILTASGSLKNLSATPSCNLPSLGVRELSSDNKRNVPELRGYLYYSDLVKNLPQAIVRPALRILSGKVILAARIDLSLADPSGSAGKKYHDEVLSKTEKLLTPPEVRPDKALPAPDDKKSKKRAGRKFRKMKEKFQMSELRRAQNKMKFGEKEETYLNSYQEEIGLGMSREAGTGKLSIGINPATAAKLSKSMSNRIDAMNINSNSNDFSDLFSNTYKITNSDSMNESKWSVGMKKRPISETSFDETNKMKKVTK